MSYKEKLEQSKQKSHNSLIATKILDLMDKIRLDVNENAKRRWIWELLQNAKDVAFEDQQVTSEINIINQNETQRVTFSHNGKPFTIDNITFLIEQVSTKERNTTDNDEKPKTTGKFGTGFLTTHLLSEKVEVSGVIKEANLNYINFVLPLDRSGRTPDQIIESVENSISVIYTLDSQPALANYNQNNFNTTFAYNLDEEGYNVAKIGINDLHLSLPYTLAFLQSLKSVSIKHENVSYELSLIENLTETINLYTIHKKTFTENEVIKIITLEKNNTTLAIEIEQRENKTFLKSLSNELPKIFCDFPLIGTNDFALPFVINNPNFNIPESRDRVYLTDNNKEPEILKNKEIFQNSIELYFDLLDYAIKNNWENLFIIANFKTPTEKEWFSKKWFDENIQKPIRNKLLKASIVDTVKDNRRAIVVEMKETRTITPCISFPTGSIEEIEKIGELFSNLNGYVLPNFEHLQIWSEIIWDSRYKLSTSTVISIIENCENLNKLSSKLNLDIEKTIVWLNNFYSLDSVKKIINLSKNQIIPNQNGDFKYISRLKIDKIGINNTELIDILESLGGKIKERLVYSDIDLVFTDDVFTDEDKFYTSKKIADEITNKIDPRFLENPRTQETKQIFNKLFLLFNNNNEHYEKLFSKLYGIKHRLYEDKEIIEKFEKADLYDLLVSKSGISPNVLKEIIHENQNLKIEKRTLEQEIVDLKQLLESASSDSDKSLIEAALLEKTNQLHQKTNEMAVIGSCIGSGLSKQQQKEINEEARRIVKAELENRLSNEKNIQLEKGNNFEYELMGFDGFSNSPLMQINGEKYPVVVKSYKKQSEPFNINTGEWELITKEKNSFFFVWDGNKVNYINILGLMRNQSHIDIAFNTENLDIEERLTKFSQTLRYFKDIQFKFSSFVSFPFEQATNISNCTFSGNHEDDIYDTNSDIIS